MVAVGLAGVAVVGLWRSQSTPALAPGSEAGPAFGARQVVDPDPDPGSGTGGFVWRQDAPDAWVAWTVRNDGAHDVTLTSAIQYLGPNVMPHESLSFLVEPAPGGTPPGLDGTTPSGLLDHVTVAPGSEGVLVLHVFYPAQCLATSSTGTGTTYQFRDVMVDASVLGRTTTLDVALANRLDVPTAPGGVCPVEAFGGR